MRQNYKRKDFRFRSNGGKVIICWVVKKVEIVQLKDSFFFMTTSKMWICLSIHEYGIEKDVFEGTTDTA